MSHKPTNLVAGCKLTGRPNERREATLGYCSIACLHTDDAERRIVEWLRTTEGSMAADGAYVGPSSGTLDALADAIERGEHRG